MTTEQKAIEILGDYVKHGRTGKTLQQRINAAMYFIEQHNDEKIELSVNNSWSSPRKSATLKSWGHVGGTTNQYQLWLVIKK